MPTYSLHVNNKAAAQNTYDAIVIGSGISGGCAAKELTGRICCFRNEKNEYLRYAALKFLKPGAALYFLQRS